MAWYHEWCYYDTMRYSRIRSVKIGLLYYLLILAVLCYIFVVSIGLDKGYQEVQEVSGSFMLKIKGYAETSSVQYDAVDLVTYYQDSTFLPLFLESTTQVRGNCSGVDIGEECGTCTPGRTTDNGIDSGVCNTTTGFCIFQGWCPPEGNATREEILLGADNFTVFVRVDAAFPRWDLRTSNVLTQGDGPGGLTWGFNLFEARDLLRRAGVVHDNVTTAKGAVIRIRYTYNCNLDNSITSCSPELSFFRVDDKDNKVSTGYNLREVNYDSDPDEPSTTRVLQKKTGLLFQVELVGQGGRFSIVALLTRIGAGLALLSIAAVIADFIIVNLHKYRSYYVRQKFFIVEEAKARAASQQTAPRGGLSGEQLPLSDGGMLPGANGSPKGPAPSAGRHPASPAARTQPGYHGGHPAALPPAGPAVAGVISPPGAPPRPPPPEHRPSAEAAGGPDAPRTRTPDTAHAPPAARQPSGQAARPAERRPSGTGSQSSSPTTGSGRRVVYL